MLWKEWLGIRSMFLPPNHFLSGIWTLVVLMLAFGVYEPIKSVPDWILSPSMLFSSMILIPFCISGTLTPDSFAGERECHTLELLLATPLSDQVLLYGKLVFPAILGWTAAMMALLAGIFAANKFSLSSNPFMSHFGTIGVAASLHALNVIQAQLKLVTSIFPLLLIPAFLIGPFSPVQLGSFANQLLPSIGLNQLLL
jgi:ABC-2 type transport system permease protein